jgi:upstream activation factor subunit UAF30
MAKKKAKAKGKRKSGLTQTTYMLSDELAAVVGSKKLTRPQVVKQLWVYIKKHKLQDPKKTQNDQSRQKTF